MSTRRSGRDYTHLTDKAGMSTVCYLALPPKRHEGYPAASDVQIGTVAKNPYSHLHLSRSLNPSLLDANLTSGIWVLVSLRSVKSNIPSNHLETAANAEVPTC